MKGDVRLGFLVGTRNGDRIDFRYSQLNARGNVERSLLLADRRAARWTSSPERGLVLESKPGEGTSAIEELH